MGWKQYLKERGYSVETDMDDKIAEWWQWYTATHAWYSSTTTVDGKTFKVERISIKPARMVCQEWASLLMNERTLVATDNDVVNTWLDAWLKRTKFMSHGQGLVERAFALGTGGWALRGEDIQVSEVDGRVMPSPNARIIAQRFDARHVIPLSYDEDTCSECCFRSSVTIRGARYDQLQLHLKGDDGTYVIETALFDKDGKYVELEDMAARIETLSEVPLFALVRPGLENTIADFSPFGVSVFDDALGAVRLTDVAINTLYNDLYLGQKMLFLDERMLDVGSDGKIVVPRESDQQLFRKAEMDAGQSPIEDYNPDLRVTDSRMALTTALETLGQRTGLGADYFSLEEAGGVKTATEVVSDNSDLFRNVRKHENVLEPAIATIIEGIISLARVFGESLPEDFGGVSVTFDDSVIEDTEALRARDLREVGSGMMQPWEYRVKWYGDDEKTAKERTELLYIGDE